MIKKFMLVLGIPALLLGLFVAGTAMASSDSQDTLSGADLALVANDSPHSVIVGGELAYTLKVTNNGPSAATGVTLTDTLPTGVTFSSATPSHGSCSQASGTVTCNLGDMAKDAAVTTAIVVVPTAPGAIVNKASVAATEADPDAANNAVTVKTIVRPAQPEVQQGEIEFTGTVQSLPQGGTTGTWQIQGLSVKVSDSTRIKGTPEVGSLVEVEGVLAPDGVVQAKKIKMEGSKDKQDEDRLDKGERPGLGLGDHNHQHKGPPGQMKKDDAGQSNGKAHKEHGKGHDKLQEEEDD